jgi:hypothetical protein
MMWQIPCLYLVKGLGSPHYALRESFTMDRKLSLKATHGTLQERLLKAQSAPLTLQR